MKSKLGFAGVLLIGATLLLKVAALLRDMVIAYYFGDSYAADAYLAAFIIPNIIFLLFNYGMKNTFVPSYIEAENHNRAQTHFNHIFKGAILSSAALAVIGLLSAQSIIPVLYPGFDQATIQLAVRTVLVFMIPVLFAGVNAMLEAYLDTKHQFAMAVFAQVIIVLGVLCGAFLFADVIGTYALAFGYTAGSLVSLIVKISMIKPVRHISWQTPLDWSELKTFGLMFIPVAISAAVGQVNLMVDNMFASTFGEGAVTYVNYAKTLVHFPQAIFGVTLGTLIFPLLARAHSNRNKTLFKQGIEQGISHIYFLLLPSIVGLIILLPQVVELFYERGSFTSEATASTVQIGYFYAGSVLFFSLADVTNKALYTLKKGHYILVIGLVTVGLNAVFNYILTFFIGYIGISLASSLTGLVYFMSGWVILKRETGSINIRLIMVEGAKTTLAALIMTLVVAGVVLPLVASLSAVLVILCVALVGATVFFLSAYLLNVNTLKTLINHLRGSER